MALIEVGRQAGQGGSQPPSVALHGLLVLNNMALTGTADGLKAPALDKSCQGGFQYSSMLAATKGTKGDRFETWGQVETLSCSSPGAGGGLCVQLLGDMEMKDVLVSSNTGRLGGEAWVLW